MSLRINLNTSAMAAHRTLGGTDNALGKSIEKLSSGYRVNSAGDDPAGLVISEKLRAQVSGLGQAIKNAGDATNMVKTAEGALGEVHRLLRGMRDLALHAANTGATDPASAQADQSQITNAINSLNKIASETQFGNRKLLDGSAGVKTFINGSNVMSGDFSFAANIQNGADVKVQVTTAAEKAKLSSNATYTDGHGVANTSATYANTSQALTTNGTISIGGTTVTYATNDTVDSVLTKINAAKGTTGVEATFNSTTGKIRLSTTSVGSSASFAATDTGSLFDGSAGSSSLTATGSAAGTFATDNGSMYVNGAKIDYSSGDDVTTFINNVNAKSDLTGVQASYNADTQKIDFQTTAYGSTATLNVTTGAMFLGAGNASASDTGVDAKATVTQTAGGVTSNVSDNSWTSGDGLTIQDSQGNKIVLTEAGGSATGAASSQFTVEKNTLTFQLGAYADQTREVNIGATFAHNLGNGAVANNNVSTIDVTTNAQDAIKVLDQAISDVSNIRASLGATQRNVLESSTNSLSVAKEMISASESTIRDTDMAGEMVEFTKLQMLNQAGVSMLAQANQAPQQLLSLLR